ncbi:hypothetical protein [Roseomonas gilardii]|uniref:hypothetical protein n=1 Tax=Roseomonas gilardii TaxID=257708 RepID=UPI0012DEEB81|nr:hypothetical protein [Roseomonas gilardii]
MAEFEPIRMTPEEKVDFHRRRRARNWAILAALLGLVVLFYLIAIARMSQTS